LRTRPGLLWGLLAVLLAWWVLGGVGAPEEEGPVEAVARPAVRGSAPATPGAPTGSAASAAASGAPLRPAPDATVAPIPSVSVERRAAHVPARAERPAESLPGTPLRTTLHASADLFPVPPAPRPPPAPPAAPPPVVAPKPQFALIGRLVDGAMPSAVLRDGERVVTLRAGQRVGGYRMESIDEDSATFVHEPTGQRVRIGFGEPGAGAGVSRLASAARAVQAPAEEKADD